MRTRFTQTLSTRAAATGWFRAAPNLRWSSTSAMEPISNTTGLAAADVSKVVDAVMADEALLQRFAAVLAPRLASSPVSTTTTTTSSPESIAQNAKDGLPTHVLRSTVKIFASSSLPNCIIPWQMRQQLQVTGSGFVVDLHRRLIITNAHVVNGAQFVEVRKHGDSNNHTGFVVYLGADCDLALVHIPEDSFWAEQGLVALDFHLPSAGGSASTTSSRTSDAVTNEIIDNNTSSAVLQSPVDALAAVHAGYHSFEGLPQLQSGVKVVGYPVGGDQLSITSGVVSRVELSSYGRDTFSSLLTVQIDAAINSGNSGGPAISTASGRVIGIAFQVLGNAESIGYIIPLPIVGAFLHGYLKHVQTQLSLQQQSAAEGGHVEKSSGVVGAGSLVGGSSRANGIDGSHAATAGRVDGDGGALPPRAYHPHAPLVGVVYQTLLNKRLRAHFGLGEKQTGIAINGVMHKSAAEGHLEPRDVLVAINGYPIENDGTIEFRPHERVGYTHLVHTCPPNASVHLRVLRNGVPRDVVIQPRPTGSLVRQHLSTDEFRERPKYCVFGGIVFSTLTNTLLTEWGDQWQNTAPRWLVNQLTGRITEKQDEVVVIVQVIPHPVNQSYEFLYARIVASVGDITVKNFAHFKELIKQHRNIVLSDKAATDIDTTSSSSSGTPDTPSPSATITEATKTGMLVLHTHTGTPTTVEVVLPIHEALEADKAIAAAYAIPPQRWE